MKKDVVIVDNKLEITLYEDTVKVSEASLFDDIEELKDVIGMDYPGKIKLLDMSRCSKLTELPKELFYSKCPKKVILPEGLKKIGDKAFALVGNIELVLPSTLETIGSECFSYSSFRSLDMSNCVSLKELPEKAFEKCEYLVEVILPEGLKKIGNSAFEKCKRLEKVNIPSTVEYIGEKAFQYCAIEQIDFPAGLSYIGDGAFADSSLKKVDLSRLEKLEELSNCFAGTPVGTVKWPKNLKRIGERAFMECEKLNRVVLPATVESIGEGAFLWSKCSKVDLSQCTKLEELPSSVFQNTKVAEVILPEGVKRIGSEAFRNDDKLVAINFPSTVEYIGEYAFSVCKSLKKLDLSHCSKLEELPERAFHACNSLEEVLFPTGLKRVHEDNFNFNSRIKLPPTVEIFK